MVNLSVTKDGTIVSVKKAIEKEVMNFLLNCDEKYQERINNWLKDFHIDNLDMFPKEQAIGLHRRLEENNKNVPVDIEMLAQAMRDLMLDFISFTISLIKENEGSHEEPTNAEDAEENAPKFFHMDQTESGFTIEGNIHPMKVVVALLAMIKEMVSDENDKDN